MRMNQIDNPSKYYARKTDNDDHFAFAILFSFFCELHIHVMTQNIASQTSQLKPQQKELCKKNSSASFY